jgi:cyclophilin family peptidyl-prolyl cis-trans isomerase/HEAT repeat protein
MRRFLSLWHGAVCAVYAAVSTALIVAGCATAPAPDIVTPAPPPPIPPVTWEQKIAWIVRLEDQRILREPNPPPPAIIQPATLKTPVVFGPPAPADLLALLRDEEARTRRRAALAVGRAGLVEGVEPLIPLLADEDVEVRQMAAFALGLIGHVSARSALQKALDDPEPIVQGRAAEALGLIGDRADADAVSGIVRRNAATGALAAIEPDDLTYPMPPAVEAVRLGLYALVRLASYDALAAAALDAKGQPISRWWPVAYALQRLGDARAAPVLLTLINTPGRYTAAFAVRGLGTMKATHAAPTLRGIVEQRRAHPAVIVQAMRALAVLGDRAATPALIKLVADRGGDPNLRIEAMTAFGTLADAESVDILIELIADPQPVVRGTALRTLARLDPDLFVATLAGLEPDKEWTVRVAEAGALGTLPGDRALPRLSVLLQDPDQRVAPAAIAALAASRPPGVEKLLIEKLKADDFGVRAAAATALGTLKTSAAVPALVDAYKNALGDSTYTARGAALAALNTIEPASGRQLLEAALADPDWALRVRAAALLQERGITPSADAIRPASLGRAVDDPAFQALVTPKFSPRAFIETDKGMIEVELAVLEAPLTVDNFITLARKGFFNGVAIHRIVPDFVVQDGDPRGDGEGGPGYTIRDELNQRPYLRGTVGMALDWEDTGGSQFFITHSPQPHLDARYTVFGDVVSGMDVVDRLVVGDIVRGVRIRDGVTPEETSSPPASNSQARP